VPDLRIMLQLEVTVSPTNIVETHSEPSHPAGIHAAGAKAHVWRPLRCLRKRLVPFWRSPPLVSMVLEPHRDKTCCRRPLP
jgi:hypothetical protein